jgi:hypothetical protein
MPNFDFVMDSNAAALAAATLAIRTPANKNGYQSDWTIACTVAALNPNSQGR